MAIGSIPKTRGDREGVSVERLPSGLYRIESLTTEGRFYSVDTERESCTCPHHVFSGAECKHIRVAKVRERRRVAIARIECHCWDGWHFFEDEGGNVERRPCRRCGGDVA